jgi:hypothetical protein
MLVNDPKELIKHGVSERIRSDGASQDETLLRMS